MNCIRRFAQTGRRGCSLGISVHVDFSLNECLHNREHAIEGSFVQRSLLVPALLVTALKEYTMAVQQQTHALTALTSACAAKSIFTTTSKPPTAASCSGVHFSLRHTHFRRQNSKAKREDAHLSRALKSAPASRRTRTTASCPLPLAAWRGVCLKLRTCEVRAPRILVCLLIILRALVRYALVLLRRIRQKLLYKINGRRFLGLAQVVQTTGCHQIVGQVPVLGTGALVSAAVLLYVSCGGRRLRSTRRTYTKDSEQPIHTARLF